MADWYQTHSFVSCQNHETAFRVYQSLELHGDAFSGGLRWGFWDTKTILISSTMRWGTDTTFVDELLSAFDVECVHENTSGEDESTYEPRVREILGAKQDFLWSAKPEVLAQLLEKFEPFDTGLTTLAVFAPRRISKAYIKKISGGDSVARGFVDKEGRAFVLGTYSEGYPFEFSPLENPQIALRIAGASWSITGALDGVTNLPPNPISKADLWKMERHGGYGLFQPFQQRHDLIHDALQTDTIGEQEAGCAMARRWNMRAFSEQISALAATKSTAAALTVFGEKENLAGLRPGKVRRESDLGTLVLTWLDLDRERTADEIDDARMLIDDEILGSAARWMLASGDEKKSIHFRKIVNACPDLFEISDVFLKNIERPHIADAFILRAAEIAYSITRCNYWKVRNGVSDSDYISQFAYSWDGDPNSKADRILDWAGELVRLKTHDGDNVKNAKRAYVALDALLCACRNNRVFWIPKIGILQSQLVGVLTRDTPSGDILFWGTTERIGLLKRCERLIELYKDSKVPKKRIEIVELSIEILGSSPNLLNLWQ